MGRLVAATVSGADDLELAALFDPGHAGGEVVGVPISDDPDVMAAVEVVVEFTVPTVVMSNLARWHALGVHAVVGTSGFDAARLAEVGERWGDGPPNCLVVPNFSIGAVLMMRFAELAAPHFSAAEVIELHHDRKADAPSGTAAATAARIAAANPSQHRHVESVESVAGSRGGTVDSVRVHSVRLPGLLAHQEVLFGTDGELLTIRHDSTDRVSFMPGVLAGIRAVADLPGLTVGLDSVLGI